MRQSFFILLDIDGVLIKPGGYRQSFINTVNYFLAFFGQPHLSVDESIAEKFEFAGIQAEWDMVPLAVAAFFDWYAGTTRRTEPFESIQLAENMLPVGNQDDFIGFLNGKIMDYSKIPVSDEIYPQAVYRHCRQAGEASVLPRIWDDGILAEILSDPLNVYHSVLFRRLENEVLGSKVFHETFGFQPEADLPSNLEKLDEPLISKHYRDKIADLNGSGGRAAILTARPNLLPDTVKRDTVISHTILPEAEMARRAIGWTNDQMIIIGVGTLCYMEEKYNLRKDAYLKPHPYHALAAILCKICENQLDALELAKKTFDLWERKDFSVNPLAPVWPMDNPIRLGVFEDSVSGIKSCLAAADILRTFGYTVTAEPYGIATTVDKNTLLASMSAPVFPDINAALDVFFSRESEK